MALESIHLFGLFGLVNVGQVSPQIYRGAAPSLEGYKTLKDLGIKTILNLERDREQEVIELLGMKEKYSPIDFFKDVDEHKIQETMNVLFDESLYPIYVHCAQGRDRTGMVVACYRIKSGWSNKDAEDEMWSFGFHFVWTHFLEFVQRYGKA